MEAYKTRVAVYLRKSRSDDPAESVDQTLDRHNKILTEYAVRNNITVIRTYKEVLSGDGLFTRPQMIALLNDVEQGLYTSVMCIDIDRLGRSSTKDSGIIMETLRDNDCRIITPEKVYDLEDETDEMTVELKAFFARQEWKAIRKRLLRGTKETLKTGGHVGAIPYGYDRTYIGKTPTLEPKEDEARIVRMIYDIYTSGEAGTTIICDKLNNMGINGPSGGEWSKNSVRMILKNPVYKGMIVWNRTKWIKKKQDTDKIRIKNNNEEDWITAKGIHPPLVSEEEFEKAQEYLKMRTTQTKFTGEIKNPYSGIVYCANCGGRVQRQVDNKGNNATRLYCTKKGCNPGIPVKLFEDTLKLRLAEELAAVKLRPENRPDDREVKIQDQISTISKQLATIKAQRSRLHDFLEQGIYDVETYMERQQELSARQTAAENEIKKLEASLSELSTREDIKDLIPEADALLESWDTIEAAEKNCILKKLISRIEYRRNGRTFKNGIDFNVKIDWRF